MAKKLILDLILVCLDQIQVPTFFGPQNLFLWVLPLLGVRNCCKLSFYAISRKTNERKLIMAKNLVSGLILAPKVFFLWILPLLYIIHCCKLPLYAISRKTNEPNLRKWQKTQFQAWFSPLWPKFGPKKIFSWILLVLDVRHCCKLSLYAISRKTDERNLRKWKKNNLVLGPILVPLAQIWATKFFFENLASSVTRCYGQLSSCTLLEKTNDPILRKLSDGRTDRRPRVISQDAVRLTSNIQNQ